jgi:hypothetical protein
MRVLKAGSTPRKAQQRVRSVVPVSITKIQAETRVLRVFPSRKGIFLLLVKFSRNHVQ